MGLSKGAPPKALAADSDEDPGMPKSISGTSEYGSLFGEVKATPRGLDSGTCESPGISLPDRICSRRLDASDALPCLSCQYSSSRLPFLVLSRETSDFRAALRVKPGRDMYVHVVDFS